VRFYRLKLSTQLNIIAISLIVILSIIMTTVVYYQMQSGIKKGAILKAKSDLAMSYHIIDQKFPGPWSVRDGLLFKGDVQINQWTDLSEIEKLTGGDLYAIFMKNVRINSNLKGEGNYIGSKIDPKIDEEVFKKGNTYSGEANVVGVPYQAAYMPIKDQSGTIIGIWGVATSKEFIDDIVNSMLVTHVIILAIMLVITVMAFMFYTNKIRNRLQIITDAMAEAGKGNFTKTLVTDSEDEIGNLTRSYNAMKSNLADIIGQVRYASEQVAASSEELMASAYQTTDAINQATHSLNQVASGAETMVNGARESARAMEELALGVQRIAESSSIVSEESAQAACESEKGNETVQKAVMQMNSIEVSVNDSAALAKQLGERSQTIGKIAELITSIASQINLLALNAAIEAARAGEHGRGFAVVANEVRKLAEQSAVSAKQIDELIKGIQGDSQKSVRAMDRVIREVQAGKELVNEAGETFQMILHAIQHVAHKIQEVSAITEEISASSEEIAAAVDETARISEEASINTQNIAASSEEQLASMDNISQSADALSKMAQELEQLIFKFKI
jgi:methyl-accepting chemotaxis protein